MRGQLLVALFHSHIADGLLPVAPRGPVVLPGACSAWRLGGLGDVGVGVMNNLLPFRALGVPRMVVPATVYAAGACLGAPFVLSHAQLRGVTPGADGTGLTTLTLVTEMSVFLAFIATHGLQRILFQLEHTMRAQVQLVWCCTLEGRQTVSSFLPLAIQEAPH